MTGKLDGTVLDAGDRRYFAKDSRTTPERIRHLHSRIDEWRRVRAAVDPDGIFRSDSSRRLAL